MKKFLVLIISIFIFGFITDSKEKRINTYTNSYQREPVVSICKNTGKYIVVWTSNGQDGDGEGIFAQYLDKNDNKIGKEFQVNTIIVGNQNKPAVDMNDQGRCIIVWASTKPDSTLQDIFGQIYDENGGKIGGEFLVNTTTIKSQNCPDVAIDRNRNFVVVWHSWDQDGSDRGIYGQRFKNDGIRLGGEFQINTCTRFSQAEPVIDMAPDGKFVVTWQSWGQETPDSTVNHDYGIYAQMFNPDGTRSGNEIHVNSTTVGDQFYPDIAISDSGYFIITWTSWAKEPNYGDIFAQRFDSKGNKIGAEFRVNNTVIEYQWLPSVAIDHDGSFAIAWGSWKQDKSREGVYIQYFKPDGGKNGGEYEVNYYSDSYQWEPKIIFSGKNQVVIVYSSYGQDGDDYGVFSRRIEQKMTLKN